MCYDSYFNYLNLSVISIAIWFPHTLFPVGLWYYTCLTCFGAFSFLSFVSFLSLISHDASLSFHSHNASLSFHSEKSLLAFHSLNSSGSTLSKGSFEPSVSSWTRHYLRFFLANLSFYAFPSLESVWPRDARHSRYTIWSWYTREAQYRSLKLKMIWNLKQTRRRNGTFNTRGSTPGDFWSRCAFRFSKSWPYFRPKNVTFYTHSQTWPLRNNYYLD